jgi:hypothetical protein
MLLLQVIGVDVGPIEAFYVKFIAAIIGFAVCFIALAILFIGD